MDVARSPPQRARCHADVIYLNRELRREHRGYGAPSKVYTNLVPDQHLLYPLG